MLVWSSSGQHAPLLRALCEIEDMRAVISLYEKVTTFRGPFPRSRDSFRTAVDCEGRAEWRNKCEFRLNPPPQEIGVCPGTGVSPILTFPFALP